MAGGLLEGGLIRGWGLIRRGGSLEAGGLLEGGLIRGWGLIRRGAH